MEKKNCKKENLQTRFMKTNDFDKLIHELEKENYKISITGWKNNLSESDQFKYYGSALENIIFKIKVYKNKKKMLSVIFQNNKKRNWEEKQTILKIYN